MLYTEYEEYKAKYYSAQRKYDKILSEKEKLFLRTQPGSIDYSKDKTEGGTHENTFDTFVIKMEKKKIDERLEVARSILEDREKLFKLKEKELRNSKDWSDIIYVYYYIEKLSIRKIERRIPFSKSGIDRILKRIEKNINLGQKWTKGILK